MPVAREMSVKRSGSEGVLGEEDRMMALRGVHSWVRGLLFAGRLVNVERARVAMRVLRGSMVQAWWVGWVKGRDR